MESNVSDETKPEKPVIAITDLGSFAPGDVDVTLEFDDHSESVPMRALSYAEFQRLGWLVPNPKPPISGVDGNRRPVFDFQDATYQRQAQEADNERAYRRLLASLRLNVPGNDDDEKIAYLKSLDANRMALLLNVVGQLVTEGKAHVEAKAAGFQRGRKTRQ
jgi:hypothetical protein